MDEPGFTKKLAQLNVVIWGLGLMGGSLALALKGKCARILGIDTSSQSINYAVEHGIVDAGYLLNDVMAAPGMLLKDTDLFILATPVCTVLEIIQLLPDIYADQAMVMDLGSTKQRIVTAMQSLPERFDPIGAHPMCGKEKSSIIEADPAIFHQATFVLAPLERTSAATREVAEEIIAVVGAHELILEPAQHDRWVAATSHLPYLVSGALARATSEEVRPLISTGFRSAARLAGSSPKMMADIVATNSEAIRSGLRSIREAIDLYEQLIDQEQFDQLEKLFQETQDHYHDLID